MSAAADIMLPDPLVLCLPQSVNVPPVRYIETFHRWAGTASNPVSPWHQQGAFPMAGHNMQSMSGNTPEPQYLLDD